MMAQAVVTIAGRTYRMNCDEGEEAHIENLARQFEAKIADLRNAFGEIGEQRIVVMAALTVADELHATQKQLAEAKAAVEAARAVAEQAQLRQHERVEWAAKALDRATAKVVAATKALNAT
jgi:cell division protein ZapA